MNLNNVSSWASIIGLVVTIVTFFLAANVNQKVSGILKSKYDRSFFDKKIDTTLTNLRGLQDIAQEGSNEILFSTSQYAKLNNAIELVGSSWDVLMKYERKRTKKRKIAYWNEKFQRLRNMYNSSYGKNRNELISFLAEFITFLEKERDNNE